MHIRQKLTTFARYNLAQITFLWPLSPALLKARAWQKKEKTGVERI
jgi:hypothetical protein